MSCGEHYVHGVLRQRHLGTDSEKSLGNSGQGMNDVLLLTCQMSEYERERSDFFRDRKMEPW